MDKTNDVHYNIPRCPGISPHPDCDSFKPIDSLRYLRLCIDDFGEIHCKYACAFCESEPNVTEEESEKYNHAFMELHEAFEYLPDGIMESLIEEGGLNCPACAIAGGLSVFPTLAKYSRPRPISNERYQADEIPDTIDSFPCHRATCEAFEDMPEQIETLKDVYALEMMRFREFPALPPPIIQQTKNSLVPGLQVLNQLVGYEMAFEDDQEWKYAIADAERSLQHFTKLKEICPEYGDAIQKVIDYDSTELADLKSGKIRERRLRSRVALNDITHQDSNKAHIEKAGVIISKIWSIVMTKQQASGKMLIARTTLDDLIDKYPDDVISLSPQRYRFNCLHQEFGMLAPDEVYNATQKKCSQM